MFYLWLQEINSAGAARMVNQLAALQPALASLGSSGGGSFVPEASRAFERARTYYTLLTAPAESLLKSAAERSDRFTASEYMALLQVKV